MNQHAGSKQVTEIVSELVVRWAVSQQATRAGRNLRLLAANSLRAFFLGRPFFALESLL